jgi:hypothetical protein
LAAETLTYLVFYVEQSGHIDVWRVLQAKRDISGPGTGRLSELKRD